MSIGSLPVVFPAAGDPRWASASRRAAGDQTDALANLTGPSGLKTAAAYEVGNQRPSPPPPPLLFSTLRRLLHDSQMLHDYPHPLLTERSRPARPRFTPSEA